MAGLKVPQRRLNVAHSSAIAPPAIRESIHLWGSLLLGGIAVFNRLVQLQQAQIRLL